MRLRAKIWLARRLSFCFCGTWSCRLDWLTRCKVRRLCDAHDARIMSKWPPGLGDAD